MLPVNGVSSSPRSRERLTPNSLHDRQLPNVACPLSTNHKYAAVAAATLPCPNESLHHCNPADMTTDNILTSPVESFLPEADALVIKKAHQVIM